MPEYRPNQQSGRISFPYNNPVQMDYPSGYLKGSYFEKKGDKNIIKGELLTTRAQQLAQLFGNKGIAPTQLRQFFVQVRTLEKQLEQRPFYELVPKIQRLSGIVHYFAGRGKDQNERTGREVFKKFIEENRLIAEKDENSFKNGLVPHFEAIIAYYKYYFPGKD